jgi:hypothetical protein
MVTMKFSPYTNVTSTDFGLDHSIHGGFGWRIPTSRRRNNCQTKKLKSGYEPNWGPTSRRNGRQTVSRNVTWTWTSTIALQITDPASRQRGLSTPTNPQLSKNDQREKGRNCTRVPDGCLTPSRTGRLTVGRIVILTLTLITSCWGLYWFYGSIEPWVLYPADGRQLVQVGSQWDRPDSKNFVR